MTKSIWPNDSNKYPILWLKVELNKCRDIRFRSVLDPVFVWSACVLENHNLLENPWYVLIANTEWFVLFQLVKNVRFYLWINNPPNLIIHWVFSIPRVYSALSQALVKLYSRSFNINFMLRNYLIKLVFGDSIISYFWFEFT